MGGLTTFGFGCLGGLLLNLLNLLELHHIPRIERQTDFRDALYWLNFLGRPIIGGVLAWAYWFGGEQLGPIPTMNIGISAPLIIKAMAAAAPENRPERTN